MPASSATLPLIDRAAFWRDRTAIIDPHRSFTYAELLDQSHHIAHLLLCGRSDLHEERVAFLAAPGFPWVALQWGIWRAGGIAVPLPLTCPKSESEYIVEDTGARTILFDSAAESTLRSIAETRGLRAIPYDHAIAGQLAGNVAAKAHLPALSPARRAMILYTSGTTSRPKGVVTTHANITAQITSLIDAWAWSADDRIALCLPLHHVHGIINVLSCALWSGATCRMLPRFEADAIWDLVARNELTLFMAVPTIYVRLIAAWEAAPPERRVELTRASANLRLMVSGSAALPVSTLHRWCEITGHTLLERYGMTEIGMALSNPLHGERIPGSVGTPLPNAEIRLVCENGEAPTAGSPGEIEVRGPNVFQEYWNKPDATRESFRDGWFRTGDTAVIENGAYRILGRTSIDILKTGGHKVSALEIEEALRAHPAIAECAVVGIPDAEWGERVAAAVVLNQKATCTMELQSLRDWARESLATHKLPTRLLVLDALPRNAMGKVVKPAIAAMFDPKRGTQSTC